MGHQDDDESRSVVGFMPVKEMKRFREHAGDWHGAHSEEVVHGIRQDIQDGKGIHTPLTVHYDHKRKWGYIGEGNHRLRAADEEGLRTVPVRVVRNPDLSDQQRRGVGAPMHMNRSFDERNPDYVPSDIHPYHFMKQAAGTPSNWNINQKTKDAQSELEFARKHKNTADRGEADPEFQDALDASREDAHRDYDQANLQCGWPSAPMPRGRQHSIR
jgi:hypothetical protein